MEQQYSILSKEIETQIAITLQKVLNNVAEDNKNKSTKIFYKKKDFCKEVGISYNTLQLWINKENLPVIQVEGLSLIDMRDAERFLEKHKI